MDNDICGLWKELSDCLRSCLRKKQELPSTISTDNSSSEDDSLASSNAACALHWIMKVVMAMLLFVHWSHSVSLLFLMIYVAWQ